MKNMEWFNKDTKLQLLNRAELLKIFDYLNERLKENSLIINLTVYGGAVMSLIYDNRPATRDVDYIFNEGDYKLFNNIIEDTGDLFGLGKGWMNEDIKEPLEIFSKEELGTFKSYSNLTILKPSAKQLLAMKILSARPEPAKDFVDAFILAKDLNIETKEELLSVINNFYPIKFIGERQLNFIRYLGEDLGYDWK